MQQGSLIRSARKRGPDVWQFRWADRGPFGKRIYRKQVIGTACQYADADSARKAVTGLLREINANVFQRCHLPMTIAEVIRPRPSHLRTCWQALCRSCPPPSSEREKRARGRS